MGRRIKDLEKNVAELMSQAGMEASSDVSESIWWDLTVQIIIAEKPEMFQMFVPKKTSQNLNASVNLLFFFTFHNFILLLNFPQL